MAEDYDPNAQFREPVYSDNDLNSRAAELTKIGNGVDPTKRVGLRNITQQQIEENCCVPDEGMSPEQRNTVEEFQMRMGVGMERMRSMNRNRTYHYFR